MAAAHTERLTIFCTPAMKAEVRRRAEGQEISESDVGRALLVAQLRYLRMKEGRERRGLPPFRAKPLQVSPQEADKYAASILEDHPEFTSAQVAFNVLRRKAADIGDGKAIRVASAAAKRAINQRDAERLEAGFTRKNREHDFRDAAETFENEDG